MSQRRGSNINSPIFMEDPIPVHNRKNNNVKDDDEQSFIIKGNKTKHGSSETHRQSGADDDIFIINGEGGSFRLFRKSLKQSLIELKEHANVYIQDLSPENTELFRSVVDALGHLYKSASGYDHVLSDVHDIFSDVENIKPGTVAAFFIGCFTDDNFPGPMGCNPRCASSLPPPDGSSGYKNCEDLVLIYSEKLFSSLNEIRSEHAYIYIGDDDFSGFTQENIQQLNEADIKNVSLIYGNKDGSYREVTGILSIDQLPQYSGSVSLGQQNTQDNDTNNSGAAVVFAIIIVVIIVLLLVVLYRSNLSR